MNDSFIGGPRFVRASCLRASDSSSVVAVCVEHFCTLLHSFAARHKQVVRVHAPANQKAQPMGKQRGISQVRLRPVVSDALDYCELLTHVKLHGCGSEPGVEPCKVSGWSSFVMHV